MITHHSIPDLPARQAGNRSPVRVRNRSSSCENRTKNPIVLQVLDVLEYIPHLHACELGCACARSQEKRLEKKGPGLCIHSLFFFPSQAVSNISQQETYLCIIVKATKVIVDGPHNRKGKTIWKLEDSPARMRMFSW
jgi:hypothetical protein